MHLTGNRQKNGIHPPIPDFLMLGPPPYIISMKKMMIAVRGGAKKTMITGRGGSKKMMIAGGGGVNPTSFRPPP